MKYLCDNNEKIWGKQLEGKEILSPNDAVNSYTDAVFIVALVRGASEVIDQLKNIGLKKCLIRVVDMNYDGQYDRAYLSERVGDKYFIDTTVKCDPFVPALKSIDATDHRDFRISIDSSMTERLDSGVNPFLFDVMNDYEKTYGKYKRIEDLSESNDLNSVKILIACSHKDYAIMQEDNAEIYVPIQVGKALTDKDMHMLCDNTGDNISNRNYNYCECSALYWAWKNNFASDADYLGLRHYRRTFQVSDKILRSLRSNGVDIIHVDPMYHANIRRNFSEHTRNDNDWDVMREAVKKVNSEYIDAFYEYENQHFVCGYNMNIFRRDIFDDFCEFLFGTLLYIENHYLSICDRRDRYLGFLAENLCGVYFIKNRDRYVQAVAKVVQYLKY